MATIKLDTNYQSALRASRPIVLHKMEVGKFGAQRVPVVIPPLNTNIAFAGSLPQFKMPPKSIYKFSAGDTLPTEWNWREDHSTDNDDIKRKKRLITKPANQAKCGSCWAISTAGVISDCFVVEKGYNPDISTTYSLACYPQGQCNGGFPPALIKDIESDGVASNKCVDYSWCLTNENCSGLGQSHFSTTEQLNGLIPKCGCYSPPNHFLYYIKNPNVIYLDDKNKNAIEIIKSHVYNHGPAIGGYHVLSNFFSGDYSKSGDVYLEDVDYNGPGYFLGQEAKWMGSHAVAIIGWGVAKGLKVKGEDGKETTADVPYWYVRNSWGPNWGKYAGYFKIAMYPFNKRAQFEKIVDVTTPGGIARTGGVLTFVAGDVKPGKFDKVSSPKLLKDEAFYSKDEPVKEYKPDEEGGGGEARAGTGGGGNTMTIVLIIALILAIVGGYFLFFRKKY